MLASRKIIKKVTETEFMEVGNKYNLKWERNLNAISLPLKNIEVITHIITHDREFDFDRKHKEELYRLVTPNVTTSQWIGACVDQEKMQDNLCYLAKTENKKEFKIVRSHGNISVFLKPGEPVTDEHEKFNAGTYHGICFRRNYNQEDDDIIFELYMPKEQLQVIVNRLKSESDLEIQVEAYFASFTDEVDDNFREYNHSRELLIDGYSRAFLSDLIIRSKIGNHVINTEIEEKEDGEIEDDYLCSKEPEITEQIAYQQLLQVINNLQIPIKSITIAIWVLAITLIIRAFVG
jgi:hypothetical protein